MEKVIQASQNDFEESGVDQSTLEEMKQVCCNLATVAAVAPSLPLRRSSTHLPRRHGGPARPCAALARFSWQPGRILHGIDGARGDDCAMAAGLGGGRWGG